jgi:hypothetical protein
VEETDIYPIFIFDIVTTNELIDNPGEVTVTAELLDLEHTPLDDEQEAFA